MTSQCRSQYLEAVVTGNGRWPFILALLFHFALVGRYGVAAQNRKTEVDAAPEQKHGEALASPSPKSSTQDRPHETWEKTVSRLSFQLESGKPDSVLKAEQELLAIRDPEAIPVLMRVYERLSQRSRMGVVQVLCELADSRSTIALARIAVTDSDSAIRNAALDQLKGRVEERTEYQRVFREGLQSKQATLINNSAQAILTLKLTGMIPSLARALTSKTDTGSTIQNWPVRDALVKLTGVDFEYNSRAWEKWWSSVQRAQVRPDLVEPGPTGKAGNGPTRSESNAPADQESPQENADRPFSGGSAKETGHKMFFRLAHWLESRNPDLISRAESELLAVRDPDCIPIIVEYLDKVSPANRVRLIGVLGQIDDTRATIVLSNVLVRESELKVRQSAIGLLRERPETDQPEYQRVLALGLKSHNEVRIGNSAEAIAELKATDLIDALIEALDAPVSMYVPKESGYLLQFGTWRKWHRETRLSKVDVPVNQERVLLALVTLTGQDFRFDKSAWRNWWRQQGGLARQSR